GEPATAFDAWRTLRHRQPVVLGELVGEFQTELTAVRIRDDERMVRRDAYPAAHLRSHLDQLTIELAARENRDRHELRAVTPLPPRQHLEPVRLEPPLRVRIAFLLVRDPLPHLGERPRPDAALAPDKHRFVSGEARAPEATPRAQELRPDARVQAHPPRDFF